MTRPPADPDRASSPGLASVALALAWVLAGSSPAWANVGLPMIVVVWPAAWMLFIPVVLAEAVVARKVLGPRFGERLAMTIVANLASTLVGIPVAWFALVLVEGVSDVPGWIRLSPHSRVLQALFMSAWFLPTETYEPASLEWMVPLACASLCLPFFLVSVACEGLVARWFLGGAERGRAWRWAWIANGVSYGLIGLGLGLRVWAVLHRGGGG